jgi:hypothetical protein
LSRGSFSKTAVSVDRVSMMTVEPRTFCQTAVTGVVTEEVNDVATQSVVGTRAGEFPAAAVA